MRSLLLTFSSLSLLSPAPAAAETLVSDTYPVQVHFTDVTNAAYAAAVLTAVEDSWAFQVDVLGFLPPPPDNGAHGGDEFDVFVTENNWGGMTVAAAPATDRELGHCSFIEVDPSVVPAWALPLVMAHEFHHAVQIGIRDVGRGAGESGALLVSALQRPGEQYVLSYHLGINDFQAFPERSLDWQQELGNFYPYGSVLFFLFVEQEFGEPSTLALYKSMWDLLATSAVPDYLAALESLIDLDAAYATFATWRIFVGPEDDGAHIQGLDEWEGTSDGDLESVALAVDLAAAELPIAVIREGDGPMPYGASYIRLDLHGLTDAGIVHLHFAGTPTLRFAVRVVLTGGGQPAEEHDLPVQDGSGSLAVAAGAHDTLFIACANLGDGTYVPDGSGWRPSTFSLGLASGPSDTDEPRRQDGGCAATPGEPRGAWGVLLLLLLRRARPSTRPG
jgi:hypothetical protein